MLRKKARYAMKKIRIVLLVLMMTLFLGACVSGGNQADVEELQNTLSEYAARLTVQAGEIETLKKDISENPEPCSTCEPCQVETQCPIPTPCSTVTPCPVCPTAPVQPTPTATMAIPVGKASISGTLSYPSEHIPAQKVVAFNTKTGYYYWVHTNAGQSSYMISDLPAGTYKVVSYVPDGNSGTFRGGYTNLAACNLTCAEDHTLIEFELKEGETKTGINPIDWYAGPDVDWPAEPKK